MYAILFFSIWVLVLAGLFLTCRTQTILHVYDTIVMVITLLTHK